MQLYREEFLRAVAFVKHAILVSEATSALTYMHVTIKKERCRFTAADHFCGKRALLYRPITIQAEDIDEPENQDFLISKAALESFETLCTKHRAKLKDAIKRDPSLRLIEIGPNELESHGVVLTYDQPKIGEAYPALDQYFDADRQEVTTMLANPKVISTVLKGFDVNKTIEIIYAGEEGPICVHDGDYFEAFYLPVRRRQGEES